MTLSHMQIPSTNFYRRPLPEACTQFTSAEGKRLFTEALIAGTANIFFKLSSQFLTQDDPTFCGLSSLVMVLNALEVDPGRVWRAPWRFYHESMLDCCVPVDYVKKFGLTLQQVSCLAACNRLESRLRLAEMTEESLNLLRADVMDSIRSEGRVLLASYSRATLGQTGSGHFSPVAAYHAGEDKVLILDVARFKYPPHWVALSLLHDAMCTPDKTTNKNRGYLNLSLVPNTRPLLVFGIRAGVAKMEPREQMKEFATSKESWNNFLLENPLDDPKQESCSYDMEASQSEAVQSLCQDLGVTTPARIQLSASIAALLFAWEFEQPPPSERARRLEEILKKERKAFSTDTANEITLIWKQLQMISCGCKLIPSLDPN